MRQSGILAAAGIYALENHVDRLKDDHDNARLLAEKLAQLPGISITPDKVQTNLVFFDVRGTGMSAQEIAGKLLQKGVRIGIESRHRMRAVTHMDVARADVAVVIQALGEVLKEPRGS
jgi:threonine aldolase